MTKWRIGFETGGKRLGSPAVKATKRWQIVSFPGPAGRESAGIVDLMAIRKNHSKAGRKFRGGKWGQAGFSIAIKASLDIFCSESKVGSLLS